MKNFRRPTGHPVGRSAAPRVAALAVLLVLGFNGAMAMAAPPADLPLIPAPQAWRATDGRWQPRALARVTVTPDDGAWADLAGQASDWLRPVLGHTLARGGTTGPALHIRQDGTLVGEAYALVLAADGVTLSAGTPAGAFRGLMSLVQLADEPPNAGLPCGTIDDAPRFGWRGLLLDCGRHFMPPAVVRQVIDALALHKGNVLHWHLTEDQGWRLEVPGLPGLTEVSAWRTEPDGTRVGGFYSAADVREIVAYAAARHITVVPEIEMPGHTVAVLAAYPELSCTGGPFAVETQWGIHPDIFCAGNDEVFVFLERVLTHVLDLFPGTFIHVGGDEAPKERWRDCPRCQVRMRTEGLADEAELQAWFIRRIETWLSARGRRLIGWDEILDGGLLDHAESAAIQSWRGTRGAYLAARAGHDAVVSPTSHAYFDYDPGVLDLQQVHGFDPVPAGLDADEARHILGGEMNLWSEYIPPAQVPQMLAPRMAAMAEALWTGTRPADFPDFLARLAGHERVWRRLGWRPGAAARPVQVRARYRADKGRYDLRCRIDKRVREVFAGDDLVLRSAEWPRASRPAWRPDAWPEAQPGLRVDGSSPAADSRQQRAAAPGDPAVLHATQLFIAGRPYGAPTVVELDPHLALGAAVTLAHPASARYPGGEAGWLVDGRRGGPGHDDGRWAGLESNDLDATVDLGRPVPVAQLSVRFLQDANAWIFLPTAVRFAWSIDGETWHDTPVQQHAVPDKEQRKLIHEFAVPVGAQARFVRIEATNRRTCPPWHPGRGQRCWLFADELVVR